MGSMARFVVVVSCGLMLVVLGLIFFSEKGVRDWMTFTAEKQRIERENDLVKQENRELARKIERFKQDIGYIEHVARHELEMVADDELVFRFRKNDSIGEPVE